MDQQIIGPLPWRWSFQGSKLLIPHWGQIRQIPRCSWRQWDTTESPLEVCFSHCSQRKSLLEPFKLTHLKDLAGGASWGTWQWIGGLPSSADRSWELPKGLAMVSEGLVGRGTFCEGTSSFLGASEVVVVGAQWALFGTGPKGEGACCPSTVGQEALGEGPTHLADTTFTYQYTGVPTIAN